MAETLSIKAMSLAVAKWARAEPLVVKAYVFGSRVKGNSRTDSDLDVAVELLEEPGEDDPGCTWQRDGQRLKASIVGIVCVPVDLDWYGGPDQTLCVHAGIQAGSLLVYEAGCTALSSK